MMRMRVGLQHVLNDPVGLIYTPVLLKGLAHAKIIKKSVILFRALNITI